jgi:hypothetical protein
VHSHFIIGTYSSSPKVIGNFRLRLEITSFPRPGFSIQSGTIKGRNFYYGNAGMVSDVLGAYIGNTILHVHSTFLSTEDVKLPIFLSLNEGILSVWNANRMILFSSQINKR